MPVVKNQDFGTRNKVSYANVYAMRYSKFFIGCLYGIPGFNNFVIQHESVVQYVKDTYKESDIALDNFIVLKSLLRLK